MENADASCIIFPRFNVWKEAGYVNEGTVRRIAEVEEEAKGEEEERDVGAERRPRTT